MGLFRTLPHQGLKNEKYPLVSHLRVTGLHIIYIAQKVALLKYFLVGREMLSLGYNVGLFQQD